MKGYYKFLTLFRTGLIQNVPLKIIFDDVKIEVFRGERKYKVPVQSSRTLPEGEESVIVRDTVMALDKEFAYIEIVARTKEQNPNLARKKCEEETNKIVTIISIVYKRELFGDLVYQGWVQEEDKGIMQSKVSERIVLDEGFLTLKLRETERRHALDSDIADRFKLASRFYLKQLMEEPNEEKFIGLWTILEIYPMKDTTNIRPIIQSLASITTNSEDVIRNKLDIGRLYGTRCNLVHNGKWDIDNRDLGHTFKKLEAIVYEILRNMCGLPYGSSLKEFLADG